MITSNGKLYIKRYLAGQVPAIAQSIAFGIGGKAEAIGDTALEFEVGRSDIVLTSYDFVADRLVFKAPLPDNLAGKVYEVALFSMATNAEAGEYASRLIASFDSDSEDWVDSTTGVEDTYNVSQTRIGVNSLTHIPAASATKTSSLRELYLDFSGNSGADRFAFAYNVNNANTSVLKLRFLTDSANYYEYNLGAQTTGYKIVSVAKSAATATGTPSWSDINEIQVITTSGAGGASSVDFDGLRIEDTDSINPNYVMVTRELLATPFVKEVGKVQDIEFALEVAV